jgi:hypothetical protein
VILVHGAYADASSVLESAPVALHYPSQAVTDVILEAIAAVA